MLSFQLDKLMPDASRCAELFAQHLPRIPKTLIKTSVLPTFHHLLVEDNSCNSISMLLCHSIGKFDATCDFFVSWS